MATRRHRAALLAALTAGLLLTSVACGMAGAGRDGDGSRHRQDAATTSRPDAAVSTANGDTPADPSKEDDMDLTITVSANGSSWDATLADTDAARAFADRLPLTLTMDELNGNEKYHYLAHALPGEAQAVGGIHAGDLMLYGDDCVVLFYESFRTPYAYTRLGRVRDPAGLAEALGTGSAEVSFAVRPRTAG